LSAICRANFREALFTDRFLVANHPLRQPNFPRFFRRGFSGLSSGGRWFRDLGDNNGQLWGHVQAVKRPTLLEIGGPLIISFPVYSNVQYRLSEVDGGTLIKFHPLRVGFIPDNFKAEFSSGWKGIQDRVRKAAEGKRLR
jgi:hypothetical protein